MGDRVVFQHVPAFAAVFGAEADLLVFPGIFKDKLDDAVIRQHEEDRLYAQLLGDREHGVCKLSGDRLLPRELVDRDLQRGEIGA